MRNAILGIALAIFIVAAVLFATVLPWRASTGYRCPYCGATRSTGHIFVIPTPTRVREGSLTRYWRKHVDPRHVHDWVPISTGYSRFGGSGVADHVGSGQRRWLLEDRMLCAVLPALPSPASRKEFLYRLWQMDFRGTRQEGDRAAEVIWTIRNAYLENPGRKDWSCILKGLGPLP